MSKYINLMEEVVEMHFDDVCKNIDCCTCSECRNDIIALALNSLPPKYFASHKGELFSKLQTVTTQYNVDVIRALTSAATVIAEHPRHTDGEEEKA